MNESEPLERAAYTGKERKKILKTMNGESVTSRKVNHSMIAQVGEQIEVCVFSA
jgi:hypothetical protein